MKGYKGFDKDLKCREFQFAVGQDFTHDGKLSMCESGFHFCENPLDVFRYYDPATSRFADVDADGVSDEKDDDSKRVCKTLHIGAELSICGMISAGVKFVLDKVDFANAKETATGYSGTATATGDRGCAVSLGIEGKAKGAVGCWITLTEWGLRDGKWTKIDVQTAKVDGQTIKENVLYRLIGGKFIEAE